MKVLEVCVGRPKDINFNGTRATTSIFKSPVEGDVFASFDNLEGDRQSDLSVHGGRDKAIYVYSHDYYSAWANELNIAKLQPSQFGENLTVSQCLDTQVVIGARYKIGNVEAVVTQPRIPCFKLGIRFNDKQLPKRFWEKGLLGFYMRVEKEGCIRRGDAIILLNCPRHEITVHDLWDIVVQKNVDGSAHALAELRHIDDGWKRRLKKITDHK